MFSEASLNGLFLRLAGVLGALGSVLVICIDFKGNMVALPLALIMFLLFLLTVKRKRSHQAAFHIDAGLSFLHLGYFFLK